MQYIIWKQVVDHHHTSDNRTPWYLYQNSVHFVHSQSSLPLHFQVKLPTLNSFCHSQEKLWCLLLLFLSLADKSIQ